MIAQLDKAKYLPFTKVFELGAVEVSHNDNDWFQYKVAGSEKELSQEQRDVAFSWYKKVNNTGF